MRILLLSANYFPELTGIGKYSGEMAEWLVASGHDVHVVSAPPYYPAWKVAEGYSSWRYKKEKIQGVTIWRCPIWVPARLTGIKRIFHLLSITVSSLPVVLLQAFWRLDVVITIEPPLLCAPAALVCARLSGAKAWLHIQDFEVDAAFELGILNSSWLRNLAGQIDKWLMRRFDKVSTISKNMADRLTQKGVDPDRVVLFPNWVDTNSIFPMNHPSEIRQQIGIPEHCIVALYSGNMGEKQGLEIVLEAAIKLAVSSEIKFVLCGDGVARLRLQQKYAGLANVIWLPLQPLEKLNDLLSAADFHLLPQRSGAEDLVLPSKLTGMLASGRPVIATARAGSQLAEILSECGMVIEPENINQLVITVRQLVADKSRRAAMGKCAREYALNHLSKERVLQNFLDQLTGVCR